MERNYKIFEKGLEWKKKLKVKLCFLLAITLLATSCGNVNTKEGTKEVEIAKTFNKIKNIKQNEF